MKISFPVFSPENSTIKTFFFTKNIIANAIKKIGGAIETHKRLQHQPIAKKNRYCLR